MKMTFNSASLVGYWWCCISNYDKLLTKKERRFMLSLLPSKKYIDEGLWAFSFYSLPYEDTILGIYFFHFLFVFWSLCRVHTLEYGGNLPLPVCEAWIPKGDITNSLGPLETLSPHLKISQRNSNPRETKIG